MSAFIHVYIKWYTREKISSQIKIYIITNYLIYILRNECIYIIQHTLKVYTKQCFIICFELTLKV
jgi:hypothetical protein